MRYLNHLQKSIDYIEENLNNSITILDCARESQYSLYHYCRVFQIATGISVMDYIRKRRISRAVFDILETNKNIKDIAFHWGFNSHENFVRVFGKEFGISPTEFRKSKYCLHMFNKIDLENLNIQDDCMSLNIQPEIITLQSFKIAGLSLQTSYENSSHYKDIPILLNKYYANRTWEYIPHKVENKHRIDYGFADGFSADGQDFNWVIGVGVKSFNSLPEGIVGKVVPRSTYAVFKSLPSNTYNLVDNLIKTWRYIYLCWLPNSGFKHAGTHELETFCPELDASTKLIHIPIVKRD